MGQMRFHAPDPTRVTPWAAERAYLAGMEGSPWQSHNQYQDGILTIDRSVSESGNLFIPWSVDGRGQVIVSTASLRETTEIYHLPVELARGAVNRVRNQSEDWRLAGLALPDDFEQELREATGLFVEAALSRQKEPESAADQAEHAIRAAYDCIDVLADEYAQQALALRHQQTPQLSTLQAGSLNSWPLSDEAARGYLSAFNSSSIPFCWKDIEPNAGEYHWDEVDQKVQWCQDNNLRICAGPLIQLDRASLPDWIYLWEDDFDALAQFIVTYLTNVVDRFRGRVHVWQCAARLNVRGELSVTEEQRLRLAVGCIETLRRVDAQTPVVMCFDQPWGEYLTEGNFDLSPQHFADALVRADLGASGLGLEINLGYWPNGTLPRDVLEFSRQVDRWSMMGLPLLIVLTAASRAGEDDQSFGEARNVAEHDTQAMMQRLLPMLLAKHSVHGVIWNQIHDGSPHEFPHGGLFGVDDTSKPIVDVLTTIRREHLS